MGPPRGPNHQKVTTKSLLLELVAREEDGPFARTARAARTPASRRPRIEQEEAKLAVGRGAQLGILFKGGEALERLVHLDAVVLDKTGTLTVGRPVLEGVQACGPLLK